MKTEQWLGYRMFREKRYKKKLILKLVSAIQLFPIFVFDEGMFYNTLFFSYAVKEEWHV